MHALGSPLIAVSAPMVPEAESDDIGIGYVCEEEGWGTLAESAAEGAIGDEEVELHEGVDGTVDPQGLVHPHGPVAPDGDVSSDELG